MPWGLEAATNPRARLPPSSIIPLRSVIVILIATACFVALSLFKAHQSPLGQLITSLAIAPYGICIIVGATEPFRAWRTDGFRSFIPLAACIAAWYGSFPAGAYLRSRLFEHNLPRFEAIIADINKSPPPADGTPISVPIADSDKWKIIHLRAERMNGALIVEFGTEHGFPVMHSGWVYSSSGVLPTDAQFHYRWP
jgi:hypothetical protein